MFGTSASRFAQRSGYSAESKANGSPAQSVALLWSDFSPKKGQKSYPIVRGLVVEIV
jgi:hypothetical protein